MQPLVKYADTILRRLKMVFGKTFINAIIKRTFFLHFCAGERPRPAVLSFAVVPKAVLHAHAVVRMQ